MMSVVPLGCQAQAHRNGLQALNTLFGPPNSGDLQSSIAFQVIRPDPASDLENMSGRKRLRFVKELWSYSDPFVDRCTMIVVLDDGSKQYTVDLSEGGGVIWAVHIPRSGSLP